MWFITSKHQPAVYTTADDSCLSHHSHTIYITVQWYISMVKLCRALLWPHVESFWFFFWDSGVKVTKKCSDRLLKDFPQGWTLGCDWLKCIFFSFSKFKNLIQRRFLPECFMWHSERGPHKQMRLFTYRIQFK